MPTQLQAAYLDHCLRAMVQRFKRLPPGRFLQIHAEVSQ
jgi:hypothetical protein